MMRIGIGYDCHQFIAGDHAMIGGVRIPHDRGVKAHSDGDVLLHALADAMLGAAALGDLGQHFPDTDPAYRNFSSEQFVVAIDGLLQERGFVISNIDSTVIAERPKLKPHVPDIRHSIARMLQLPVSQVSVKATTHETMGAFGRGEGLAAQVVILIAHKE